MRIVTMISDWKKADYYSGVIRGILMSSPENVKWIEISDQVENYRIEQAALILKNCYKYYPDGTIHMIAVRAESEKDYRFLIAEWENQFFVFSDNGFASLFWPDELPEKLYEINNPVSSSFPEATIMVKAVLNMLENKDITSFASSTQEAMRRLMPQPSMEQGVMTGTIIHADSYGNAITNVTKEYFEKYALGKSYIIIPGNNYYAIRKIHDLYKEVNPSEQIAIFNHAGYLEIAIRNGSAKDLLGLKEGTNIRIEIYDTANS